MLNHRSVSLPLFALVSVGGLHAQFADLYRQAAQSYRNAAAQEGGANQSCMLSNASYYDCLADQLSNNNLSCTQPTCSLSNGASPTSSGSSGAAALGGSTGNSGNADGTFGGPMNPMILNLMCNHCRVTGSPCPTACRAGSSSGSSPSLGGLTSGSSVRSANIQAGADLAVGLIQGIFSRRAAKQAAEEAQQEAELQGQQDAAERQGEMDELQTRMRVSEAERIQTEACNTLIEAARLTGGSVDLGGGNACAQAIQTELAPLATYGPATGRAPIQTPGPTIQLDGTNIPRVIDFGSSGSAPGNAMDRLIDSASPVQTPSTGTSAMDRLNEATAPSGSADKALYELTKATESSSSTPAANPSLSGQDSAITFGPPRGSPGGTSNAQYENYENTATPSTIEFGKQQQDAPLIKSDAGSSYGGLNQPNNQANTPTQMTFLPGQQAEVYQKPVSPERPVSLSVCDTLATQWTTLIAQIKVDHEKCLSGYQGEIRTQGADDLAGSVCNFRACQAIHNSMVRAPLMRDAAVSACRYSVTQN